VAIVDVDDAAFLKLLRGRSGDVVHGRPGERCDLVFLGANDVAAARRLAELRTWIEPDGAVWVIRPKGPRTTLRDTDLIQVGLDAGLVDNKIASFSDTHSAMRFVFRLHDRPR
jgi:hypothetical protein